VLSDLRISTIWCTSPNKEKNQEKKQEEKQEEKQEKKQEERQEKKQEEVVSSFEKDDARPWHTVNGEQLLKLVAGMVVEGKDTMIMNRSRRGRWIVAFFLPRNVDGRSYGRAAWNAGYRGKIELEQNVINGKLKTVTAILNSSRP